MKIIKTLGALSLLAAPLTTAISCSGDEESRSYYLFEGFQAMAGDHDDYDWKRKENSEYLKYMYENYVTSDNYLDYDAIDEAGYKGFVEFDVNGYEYEFFNISDFNEGLHDTNKGRPFEETYGFEDVKVLINDVNQHLNDEFTNLDINTSDETLYNGLDFDSESIRFNKDLSSTRPSGINNLLFSRSWNLGALLIGEEVTTIPDHLFYNVHYAHTFPVQFVDPSNMVSIGEYSLQTPYPSKLLSYDLTNFTSLESIDSNGLGVELEFGEDEWDEIHMDTLSLPPHNMSITEHAFLGAPINEVHYYSEFHTAYDYEGVELERFSCIIDKYARAYYPGDTPIDGGVLMVDLSDPANASYLPT